MRKKISIYIFFSRTEENFLYNFTFMRTWKKEKYFTCSFTLKARLKKLTITNYVEIIHETEKFNTTIYVNITHETEKFTNIKYVDVTEYVNLL